MPRTIPVDIKYPAPAGQTSPIVVGEVPTFATKRRYGWNALIGIFTAGNLATVVPVQHASVSLKSRIFPYLDPTDNAPDAIRVTEMTALNGWSPSGHSKAAQTDRPVPALKPDPTGAGWNMPKKQQRGTGGHYTLPSPPNIPEFPSFLDRMQR